MLRPVWPTFGTITVGLGAAGAALLLTAGAANAEPEHHADNAGPHSSSRPAAVSKASPARTAARVRSQGAFEALPAGAAIDNSIAAPGRPRSLSAVTAAVTPVDPGLPGRRVLVTAMLDAVLAAAVKPRPDPAGGMAASVVTASVVTASVGQPGQLAAPATNEPATNGVTGVKVGRAPLDIPCGPNGYTAKADWYFPTQADGSVQAQGVIWLQHGFASNSAFYSALAGQLAQRTNSIVVAPSLRWLPLSCAGCWLNGEPMQEAAASLFLGDRAALNISANAAGFQGTLPERYVLAGHSAGGGFATAVAADTVENGAADGELLGVVMFDGVSSGGFIGQLTALDTLDVPVYQIASPAQAWNAFGATTNDLLAARPDQFDGVVLVGGSHVDSMLGTSAILDFILQLVTGRSPRGNTAATYTLSTGWINDMYIGAGPSDPVYGLYGQAGQPIIMGEAAAVVLPTPIAD